MTERIPTPISRGVEKRIDRVSTAIAKAEAAYRQLDELYEEIASRQVHEAEGSPAFEDLEDHLQEVDGLMRSTNELVSNLQTEIANLRLKWLDFEIASDPTQPPSN